MTGGHLPASATGLEKLLLEFRLRRFWYVDDKRQMTMTPGEHIHDEPSLTILKRMKHNGLGFIQHTMQKYKKN